MHLFETKETVLIQSIYPLIPNTEHKYYLIEESNNIIGMFEIQPITKITGILHLHIKEHYQNKGLAIKAFNKLLEILKNGSIKQLIGTIPEDNKNIMSVVNKTKATYCGKLTNAIIYNNRLQDLLLYQLEV